MSVELLYTSASQGLKQGSRGFCTVLSTTGMPLNLATRLESLSAYRHVFPPGHPDEAQNPVGFSHLRINVGGRPLSILSRISDYGVDYSQRTNKLAHHVVLEGADLVPAGPAWVMLQSTIMRSQWDGQCATPGAGPAIPATNQSPRVCMRWSGLCKDAGWGGIVAEVFAQPTGKPLWIIFSLNQSSELLSLINESVALLPVEQRWQATFSTYATNLPPDADCKVRCVLAGTEDARLAPARGKVIDLSKPLPPIAPTAISPYVLAARNGTPVPGAVPSVPTADPASKPRPPVPHSESPEELFDVDEADFGNGNPHSRRSELASDLKVTRTPSKPPEMKNRPSGAETKPSFVPATSSRKLKLALIGLSVVALVSILSTVVLVIQRQSAEVASTSLNTNSQSDGSTQTDNNPTPAPINGDPINIKPAHTPVADDPTSPIINENNPPTDSSGIDEETTPPEHEPAPQEKPAQAEPKPEEPKPVVSVLEGKLQLSKFLKGDVCIQISVVPPVDAAPQNMRYSYIKDKQGLEPFGLENLSAIDRPKNIKNIRYTREPFTLVVEIDPSDPEMKTLAIALRDEWNSVQNAVKDWHLFLKNSDIPPQQKQEFSLEKLPEPTDSQKAVNLEAEFVAFSKSIRDTIEKILTHENKFAQGNKLTKDQASLAFAIYKNPLENLDLSIARLVSNLNAVAHFKREFNTGSIMYIGQEFAKGKLVNPIEVKATYRISPEKGGAPSINTNTLSTPEPEPATVMSGTP